MEVLASSHGGEKPRRQLGFRLDRNGCSCGEREAHVVLGTSYGDREEKLLDEPLG